MITLISPYPELSAFGIRSISSYLKKHGFKSRLIFLPDPEFEIAATPDISYKYPDYVLNKVVELCRGSDLIGISFITYLFDRATQLTEKLKRDLTVPVIWGGKHASINPEEGLKYADIVCIGEGEEAMLELAEKIRSREDYTSVRSLQFKDKNNGIIRNPVSLLNQTIDLYGMPDYNMEEHYIWVKESEDIVPLNSSLVERYFEDEVYQRLGRKYLAMTSRGCPYNCSYCFTFKRLYPGLRYLRHRSIENIIDEFQVIKKNFSGVKVIEICDDSFFSRNVDEIKEFSRLYKENIGLPLICLAHPSTVTAEKLSFLVDAGLCIVQMGIESASERTKKLYNRSVSNERVLKAIQDINKFKGKLLPLYDFIIDNPYESRDDVFETLNFILKIPKPYRLQMFSLAFFPGTKLYEKAKEDGYIDVDDRANYRKIWTFFQERYHNYIFLLFNYQVPKFIMRLFINKLSIRLFDRNLFNRLGGMVLRFKRGLKLKRFQEHKHK